MEIYEKLLKTLQPIKISENGSEVSKYQLQSCYYVHFQTNNIWKGMNLLILQLWV